MINCVIFINVNLCADTLMRTDVKENKRIIAKLSYKNNNKFQVKMIYFYQN